MYGNMLRKSKRNVKQSAIILENKKTLLFVICKNLSPYSRGHRPTPGDSRFSPEKVEIRQFELTMLIGCCIKGLPVDGEN